MTFSIEYTKSKDVSVKSVHILISGSGDSDKSHLVKTIYNTVVETLRRTGKAQSAEPNGISVANIGETAELNQEQS